MSKINLEKSSNSVLYALMGRQIDAAYRQQEINDYKGNPLIEALPPIFSGVEIANMLYTTPTYREDDRKKAPELRLHMVEQIKNYMHPLRLHNNLQYKLSILIRRGYVGRNPLSSFYARQFAKGIKNILRADLDEGGRNLIGNQSTATCHTVIGISGIGKTTAVEKILLTYPQVIVHSDYSNGQMELGYLKQIVWLKLECPFNGRRKALCQNFFRIIDQILETNYYDKFVKSRSTEEDLIDSMAHVCSLHCLGLLVIDEIQRMKPGEAGQEMLDFFVELSNKLGIPILYIGTYKATVIFDKLLANARRAGGMGADFLDPMPKDKEWDIFLNRLWKYQWTKEYVPLTEELSSVMHHYTVGITDYIIKLFVQSQQYAIAYGYEKLTPSLIKRVAKENMGFADHILDGLRRGDRETIQKFEDVKPNWIDVNEYIKVLGNRISITGKLEGEHSRALNQVNKPDNFQKLVETAISLGCSSKEANTLASKVIDSSNGTQDLVQMQRTVATLILQKIGEKVPESHKKKEEDNKIKPVIQKNDIRYITQQAKKNKIPIDELLEEKGIIKPFTEFRVMGSE